MILTMLLRLIPGLFCEHRELGIMLAAVPAETSVRPPQFGCELFPPSSANLFPLGRKILGVYKCVSSTSAVLDGSRYHILAGQNLSTCNTLKMILWNGTIPCNRIAAHFSSNRVYGVLYHSIVVGVCMILYPEH